MSVIEDKNSLDQATLIGKIQSLENRLNKIESLLRIEWEGDTAGGKLNESSEEDYAAEKAESKIVEYGFAWLGSVVFAFGIIFLMSFIESLGYPVVAKMASYASTFLLIAFAYFFRSTFPILANVFRVFSAFLLYYITLKLHFFTGNPLIESKLLVIFFLLGLTAIQFWIALQKKSEFLGILAISFCIATAILSNATYITFTILILTALFSLGLFYRQLWWRLHIFSLFMVYLTHLMWLFNNPLMGQPMKLVETSEGNILFLIGYAIIYSISIFIPKDKLESNTTLVSITIWNALGFSLLLMLIIPSFYQATYTLIFAAIAVFNLGFSVFLKLKSDRNFAPATYACFGFIALSITVYGFAGLPTAYFLLVIQSFLVVSMALWFRSQIIVVANAILFVTILPVYLILADSINYINFTFVFTALATARILNWEKERLTLKTEAFRNIYLFIAFVMLLFSLNKALPSQYVTLAWTATAVGFFVLSILLHNIKYRYLAILAIVVTAGHLFFIDLAQMDIGYRVVAFIVFAIISLGVSLYYTKRINKK